MRRSPSLLHDRVTFNAFSVYKQMYGNTGC